MGGAIAYRLPAVDFEGPLELLLELVRRGKMALRELPIAQLLEQYLAVVREWQELDLEVASEFLDMAARLVQMKSALLLPRPEQAEQLRAELVGELIEYQLCQEAARRLATQAVGGDLFVREAEDVPVDARYQLTHEAEEMRRAFLSAAGRGRRRLPPPVQAFTGIVARQVVSVSSRIVLVLARLRERAAVTYTSLFEGARSKSELVATFLALLELVKGRRVRVEGEGALQRVELLAGTEGEIGEVEEY